MVECEYSSKYSEFLSIVVLIDTWWNVNLKGTHPAYLSEGVLIDTWWNVNVARDSKLKQAIEF